MNATIAITISPPDRVYKLAQLKILDPLRNIFIGDKYIIQRVFMKCRIKRYIIYPEIDDKGRLHYHGVFTSNNTDQRVRWFKYGRPKLNQLIGYVDVKCLKTFEDRLRWLLYIKKNWGESQDLFNITEPINVMRHRRTRSDELPRKECPQKSIDFFPVAEPCPTGAPIAQSSEQTQVSGDDMPGAMDRV